MGLFALVLHTHLPYVRRNGVWPCGEDFFHQAATESYLPLLDSLERLAGRGVRDALTIGITPLIAHQMEDPHMLGELEGYLGRYDLRALRQVANYEGIFAREFKDLAAFYARHARHRLARLESCRAAGGGIAKAFGELERAGLIEILGGPASHPYLPLVREPALLRAQIAHGLAEHERLFGRQARGVWLPECAWRPGAGIEEALAAGEITHFVVDGPTMTRAAGRGGLFHPRLIGNSSVAAFPRNRTVSRRVWSDAGGYPSGRWYRDFHHYDLEAGFKNWRVTGPRVDLGGKRPYEPEPALRAAEAHAEDFVALVERTLDRDERERGTEGVLVACFDTELFGHWWFEGPAFLEHVLALLSGSRVARPVTLSTALEQLPPSERVSLGAGSWGVGGDDRSWVAPETEPMWSALAEAERETMRLAAANAGAAGGRARALDQLARETFLLQSSDWPFMVLQGSNAGYARERFDGHLARWQRLAGLVDGRAPDEELAREAAALFEIDNAFPALTAGALSG